MEGLAPHRPHRGLHPQALVNFGLNPSSLLVIGYHWLAFLNLVHQGVIEAVVKVPHNREIDFVYVSEHCASFGKKINWQFLVFFWSIF